MYKRCRLGRKPPNYIDRCKQLGLESLEIRRLRTDAVMCFKIFSGLVNLEFEHYFTLNNYVAMRNNKKLYKHVYKSHKNINLTMVHHCEIVLWVETLSLSYCASRRFTSQLKTVCTYAIS